MHPALRRVLWLIGLALMVLATGVSGCQQPDDGADGAQNSALELAQTAWRLLQIDYVDNKGDAQRAVVPEWAVLTLSFGAADVSGTTGCNRFGGSYRLSGSTIDVGDLPITQAGCPDDALRLLEPLFVGGVRSAESLSLSANQLTLIGPTITLTLQAQPDPRAVPERVESDIVTALLQAWFGSGAERVYVFRATSVTRAGDLSFSDAVSQAAAAWDADLDPETVATFVANSAVPTPLADFLDLEHDVVYLADDAVIEWTQFADAYGADANALTLGRVGLNAVGDQALAYFGVESAEFSAGYLTLFVYDAGTWIDTMTVQLWQN